MIDSLTSGLSPLSLLPKRVDALTAIFGSAEPVAELLDVRAETVRGWAETTRAPHPRSSKLLDDLRFAVVSLLESGLAPNEIQVWFTSRNTSLGGRRPSAVFHIDSEAVVGLAAELAAERLVDGQSEATVERLEADARDRDIAMFAPVRTRSDRTRSSVAPLVPVLPRNS